MSISRRGLLAAGLTAAVIGSVGVVSMLNASADDAPAPAPAAVTQADGSDDTSTPPDLLPWGAEPQKLTSAEAGATSDQVADAGADAAPSDSSGSVIPRPEWAPKGTNWNGGSIRTDTTSVQPPTPPTAAEPVPGDNPVNFFYAVASQTASSDGAYANLVIGKPYLDSGDYHTLAEISVQSADGQQIVEVGWNVDRTVNGDSDPHLFVYHWVDRKESCYNACGWQQYSSTIKPGDTLPDGVSKRFGIMHYNDAWWVVYDTEWIGYFPDDLWNGGYTRSGLQQFFGEVAASTSQPCTAMGTGEPPWSDGAARVGSVASLDSGYVNTSVNLNIRGIGGVYPWPVQLSTRTFRYGGKGAC